MPSDLVFPAPAGINRFQTLRVCQRLSVPRASGDKPRFFICTIVSTRVPRASGDKPHQVTISSPTFMCSPRQRG
ncbi:hypothetical protein AIA22_06170 [Salmonella enterica subsp. enterica]|nr:hypothetical protein [Salmonella enterica subsp. enterica serovar Miami]EAM2651538.1 hypothetical protein [Salmonella enterica]